MATSSVNVAKLQQASAEFDNIYTKLVQNENKLADIMGTLPSVWKGEAANTYINAYKKNAPELSNMAKLIKGTSTTLSQVATSYNKQESSVADAIRSMLPK